MNILFIVDPLASFKIKKDTSFAMMREAQKRGHSITACEVPHIQWQRGECVKAQVQDLRLTGDANTWYEVMATRQAWLKDFDAIIMRKDPPFDSEFFYATHLLSQAEREGAKVFNKASALRDHPEKLAIMEFPEFIGPTLVTRSADAIKAFHAEHQDIILKPLDGMGGMGIFRVGADGMNLGSIIETLNPMVRNRSWYKSFYPPLHKVTNACSSLAASLCLSAWRAFRKVAKCAATWLRVAKVWRSP